MASAPRASACRRVWFTSVTTPTPARLTRTPATLARRSPPGRLLTLLALLAALCCCSDPAPPPRSSSTARRARCPAPAAVCATRAKPAADQPCPDAAVELASASRGRQSGRQRRVRGRRRQRPDAGARPRHRTLSPSASAYIACQRGRPISATNQASSGLTHSPSALSSRFVYVGAASTATVSTFVRDATACSYRSRRSSCSGRSSAAPPACRSPASAAAMRSSVPALDGVAALAVGPDGTTCTPSPTAPAQRAADRDPAAQPGERWSAAAPGTRGCVQSLPGSSCPCPRRPGGCERDHDLPRQHFVYVASELSGAVRGFLRNGSTGALTPLYGPGGCVCLRRSRRPATCPAS